MNENDISDRPVLLTEGPFAGWLTWGDGSDPFETELGPFCFRDEGGKVRTAFLPRRTHLNGGGFLHGGALMSFADFALFAIAYKTLATSRAVTLTFTSEFLSAGEQGVLVEAEGSIVHETRSFVFVRGVMTQAGRPLLAFSGTLKKIGKR